MRCRSHSGLGGGVVPVSLTLCAVRAKERKAWGDEACRKTSGRRTWRVAVGWSDEKLGAQLYNRKGDALVISLRIPGNFSSGTIRGTERSVVLGWTVHRRRADPARTTHPAIARSLT